MLRFLSWCIFMVPFVSLWLLWPVMVSLPSAVYCEYRGTFAGFRDWQFPNYPLELGNVTFNQIWRK